MALLLRPAPHLLSARDRGRTAARLAAAALLLLAALPLPLPAQDAAAPRDSGAPAPPIAGPEALARSLDAALDDPALTRAHVGMSVRSAETGEVLYARSDHRRFTTASTAKLVTAAVALERLGAGFRWATRIDACGAVDTAGLLGGDLVITGTGDPTIDRRRLAGWAGAVRAADIRRIAGDVVGDDRAFPPPVWGRGWMWDDLHLGWAAGVDALQLAEPAVEVFLLPDTAVGGPVRVVRGEPAGSSPGAADELPVGVEVRTAPAGTDLRLRYLPGEAPGAGGRVVGWLPADRDSLRLSLAPRQPAGRLLDELSRVFADSGLRVEGAFRRRSEGGPETAGRDGESAAGAGGCGEAERGPAWSTVSRSDSLGAVLAHMLGRSDNQAAESLLRTLGREEGRAGTPEQGAEVVGETLAGWGIPPEAVSVADGAGLSRYDQASPAALTRMLRAVWLGPHRATFLDALASPGRSGTLHGRFRGVPARRSLRAKTGSLASVRALAGYVEAADGQTLAFALMIDGYHVPGAVAEKLRDRVVERLALYRAAGPQP